MWQSPLTALLLMATSGYLALAQERPPSPANGEVLDALPAEVAQQPSFQARFPRYVLRPGDTLDLQFTFTPEFNQSLAVQPDGFMSVRELGDIYVQGKTVPEVSQILRSEYAKILANPVITVVLKDFEKPYFTAGGELLKPGKYELRGDTTLTEAVATAGGFRDSAKHSEVLLFRRTSNAWVEVKKINMKEMLSRADLREDLHLQPGDMLFVPKNRISKIKQFIPTSTVGYRP